MSEAGTDGRRTRTRARLVRSATGLFRRHGVGGVGIGDVCARAGVTKGVFTHHFPAGKDELVTAVVATNAADVRARMAPAAARARTPSGLVRALFGGYSAILAERGTDLGCPVAAGVVDASARSPAVRRATHEAFTSWQAELDGHLSPEVAELAVAALEGAILLARAADDPTTVDRVGRTLATLVARPAPTRSR